jgi:hypothetical protein
MMPKFLQRPWFITLSWLLLGVVLMVGLNILAYRYWLGPQPSDSLFVLSNLKINGPTELCPGESLDFQFDVKVTEVGTYNLFMSTWKVDPPPSIIIFSETQPFVIGSKREFMILREWEIPEIYEDPANSQDTPMVAGSYIRDIAVTAEGKNTINVPVQVAFQIKEDCES